MVCEVFVLGKKIINKMLKLCEKITKKPVFDPFISIPGVNNNIITVNITKLPLYFHSRHDNLYLGGLKQKLLLIIKNWLGMGWAVNVNKTDQITSTVNIRSVRSQRWQKKELE